MRSSTKIKIISLIAHILMIVFILSNVACSDDHLKDLIYGPPKDPRIGHGVDPEFIPYVNEFESYYKREVYGIPITFESLSKKTLGSCYRYQDRGSSWYEIRINSNAWSELSALSKKFLIFHELGHCVLGRGHLDTINKYNCAASIMNTLHPSEACLAFMSEDYIKELFNK